MWRFHCGSRHSFFKLLLGIYDDNASSHSLPLYENHSRHSRERILCAFRTTWPTFNNRKTLELLQSSKLKRRFCRFNRRRFSNSQISFALQQNSKEETKLDKRDNNFIFYILYGGDHPLVGLGWVRRYTQVSETLYSCCTHLEPTLWRHKSSNLHKLNPSLA